MRLDKRRSTVSVQAIDGGTRVTMRVVKVETSRGVAERFGRRDGDGEQGRGAEAAAEDALAGLDMLHTQ